jgi:hypothetical protein
VIDFHCARIKTALTLLDGTMRLLGVWTPTGTPEFAKGDVMQAAYFGANLLPMWPEENKALLGRLERHIAKVGAPPPAPNQKAAATQPYATKAPPGMETWSFQVPPDFLNCYYASEKPGPPVDPFKPDAQADPSKPGVFMRDGGPTPADILKQAGIPMPEGSDMRYEASTGTYFVTNTPANLELVRHFVDGLYRRSQAKLLSHTLRVVEGDGALIRRLAAEAATRADHQSLWKQVEELAAAGQIIIRSTMRLDGRSGKKILCEAGTLHMSAGALRFGDVAEPSVAVTKDGAQPKAPDLHFMTAKNETRMVGTRLELDPVIGPDGWTVDAEVALEHHFASPTTRSVAPPSGAGVFRAEVPSTDFHFGKVLTPLVCTSGMTKFIGLWPIEEVAEFKGKDVMQAAFLRVDVVTLRKE